MNNINEGFVLLPRQIQGSEVWQTKKAWWLKVWLYLVMEANHKDNGQFKRGWILTSVPKIYADCYLKNEGISERALEHCIKWLKSCNQIAVQKTTRGMKVFICNYAKYQTFDSYKSGTESGTESGIEAEQKRNDKQTLKHENNNTSKKLKKKSTKKEGDSGMPRKLSAKQTEEIISRLSADVNPEVYRIALRKSFGAKKLPTNVPTYLLDYDDNELLPFCVEMSLDNHDMRKFAREIYEKYKGGVRIKSGKPILNYKTFFMNIVRADIERLHKRFKSLTWSL